MLELIICYNSAIYKNGKVERFFQLIVIDHMAENHFAKRPIKQIGKKGGNLAKRPKVNELTLRREVGGSIGGGYPVRDL